MPKIRRRQRSAEEATRVKAAQEVLSNVVAEAAAAARLIADEEAAELPYEISEHPGDDGVDQDDGDGSADVRMLLADVFKPKDVSSKDSPR